VEAGTYTANYRDGSGVVREVATGCRDESAARSLLGKLERLLSKGGVKPRTAQAAVRHSTINLTMNVHTDPKLLDVASAMESLPSLPLTGGTDRQRIALSATGTDDLTACQFAPGFAPTTGKTRILQSIMGKITSEAEEIGEGVNVAASAYPVKERDPLTTSVNGSLQWAMRDSKHPRIPQEKHRFLVWALQNPVQAHGPLSTPTCKRFSTRGPGCPRQPGRRSWRLSNVSGR
jgi:hypothetical protein